MDFLILFFVDTGQLTVKIDQQSDVTRKEVKEKIKPSDISVGVASIKIIKNGAIVVNCHNQDDVKNLENAVTGKLGDKYQVKITTLRNPQIKIVGMSEKFNEQQIINQLIAQNNCIINKEDITIKKKFERKNTCTAIAEVEAQLFLRIMKESKLNVGWDRCPVYEELNLWRCYKCNGYNHKAANCRNESACSKCSENHHSSECMSEIAKCVNCLNINKKLKMIFEINHSALDKDCPVFCRKASLQRNKTNNI